MKHLMLLLASLLWYLFSHAAITYYYVSFSGGNDANTAAQAQSPSTPWKTMDKVLANINSGTIAANSYILLKKGDAWLWPRNFNVTKSLTFDSYGPGNIKPYCTGLVNVPYGRWTLKDANLGIWETTDTIINPLSNTLNMLLINSQPYAIGRTPNGNSVNKGWLNYEAHTSSSVTDSQSPFDASYVGAQLVLRTNHSNVEKGTVTAISGTTITFSTSAFKTSINGSNGYGYFLQNSLKCLDQFGEWYYNTGTKKISLCVGQLNNPNNFNVQYPYLDTMIQPRASNISFNNIAFTGANRYVCWNDWSGLRDIWYNGCDFAYSGGDFTQLLGKIHSGVNACTANYANSNAFSFSYHNNGAYVMNSRISNIGRFVGMLWPDAPLRYGVGIFYAGQQNTTDTGLIATNNYITNIGYSGTSFLDGNNSRIMNNFVDTVCNVLDDGGCYYMENYTASGVPKTTSGNIFYGNIGLHSMGVPEGTPGNNQKWAYGLYFDDYSNKTVATYNTLAFCGNSGIFVHDGNRLRIENNTSYNNESYQIRMQDDGARDSIYLDTVRYNSFMALNSSQIIYYLALGTGTADNSDFDRYGIIESNKVLTPFTTNVTQVNHTGILSTTYNLANWRSTWHYDLASTIMPITVASAKQIYFVYNNNLETTNGFYFPCDRYISVSNVTYFNSIMLKPLQSEILLLQNL